MAETVMPCRLGCVRLDDDGHEVPLPGLHGGYCERDYGVIRAAWELAPALIRYLRSLVPSALSARPTPLGNKPTRASEGALPFNVTAYDDLRRAERIVEFSYTRLTRFVNDRLVLMLDFWLAAAEPDEVARLKADAGWLRRTNLKWPTEDKPVMSVRVLCPLDGGRVLVVPPKEPGGDREYVCAQCGNMMTEQQADQASRLLAAVADEQRKAKRAAAARERRALSKDSQPA